LASLAEAGDYADISLSPDGTRLAVSLRDPERGTHDLWLLNSDGGKSQRLTSDPADEFAPVWSADGRRLLFSAAAGGQVNLLLKDVSALGDSTPLAADRLGLGRYAADWSPDGRHVLYIAGGRAIERSDLWTTPVAGSGMARALLDSRFVETHGRFSPTGDWFVYTSSETGRFEVYVDRFPQRGAKRRVSTDGGAWPRWSRDGREIFYLSPDNQLIAAPVHVTGERLETAAAHSLFVLRPRAPGRLDAYAYDVSPDGRRIVVNTFVEDESADTITLVLNWAPTPEKR
jgi:Tol biopolymer transport system component